MFICVFLHRIIIPSYLMAFSFVSTGNKMSNVGIVYTMWNNLKKTGNMAVGQVGFNVQKEVRFSTS